MPIQTFFAKIVEFKLPMFYNLMQELSKSNDVLTFVVNHDKLFIKTSTNTLNILVTLSYKLFDSFQIESPKMYTIFSRSIRDVFSGTAIDLSSLRITIEESSSVGEENLMIFEICRKMRSIRSRYNIFCNEISEIDGAPEPLNVDPSSEQNFWSIKSEILSQDNYWPPHFKNESVRFLFGEDGLRVINITDSPDNDEFFSDSRYSIPSSKFDDYNVTNPIDIKINRKSFEKIMRLVLSLKCNLNAYISDKDSDDPYQPQPLYLCGEIKRYIKIEGKILGPHIKYGNIEDPPLRWEIESVLNAPSQINQNANSDNGIVYQVAEGFRQEGNTELSNSFTLADENYMPHSAITPVNGNDNTSDPMDCTIYVSNASRNNLNHSRINNSDTSISSITGIPSIYNSQDDNRSSGFYEPSSSSFYGPPSSSLYGPPSSGLYRTASESSLTTGEEISRRSRTIKFNDNRVGGVKRSFSATDLDDDNNMNNMNSDNSTIRSDLNVPTKRECLK